MVRMCYITENSCSFSYKFRSSDGWKMRVDLLALLLVGLPTLALGYKSYHGHQVRYSRKGHNSDGAFRF